MLMVIIFQSYVAGQIEAHMDNIENWLEGLFKDTALGLSGGKIASIVSARAGESAIHYMFLRKIGHTMIKQLRPLSIK
jgi:hypothetical protein